MHIIFKKIASICLFMLLIAIHTEAQERPLEVESIKSVNAANGMYLFAAATEQSQKIAKLPFQEKILILTSPKDKRLKTNGIDGYWRQAYYKGQYGYVFDAFLEEEFDEGLLSYMYAPYYIVYKSPNVAQKIYDKAQDFNSKILNTIEEGELVLLLDSRLEGQQWVKVRYKNTIGYIQSEYLISHDAYPLYWESLEDTEAGD